MNKKTGHLIPFPLELHFERDSISKVWLVLLLVRFSKVLNEIAIDFNWKNI